MNELHVEEYWSRQFDIAKSDLECVAEQLQRAHAPQDLKSLAVTIVQERIEHDPDFNSSSNVGKQVDAILTQHSDRILSRLDEALSQDSRFTCLEDKWYLVRKLNHIGAESLQAVHHFLLEDQPALLDSILSVLETGPTADPLLLKMAIQVALQRSPERFENVGTSTRPVWKARLPEHDQARVTHYAFDPRTFEILCRPGQWLSQKKAQRLQELNLYAHVVTFSEWNSLANH